MRQQFLNKSNFPNPPIDSRITHYDDSQTGKSYFWDGTQYVEWAATGNNPPVPSVFQGFKEP